MSSLDETVLGAAGGLSYTAGSRGFGLSYYRMSQCLSGVGESGIAGFRLNYLSETGFWCDASLKEVEQPALKLLLGANWVRPDGMKCKWRVVVGRLATLKADQKSSIAEDTFALAA